MSAKIAEKLAEVAALHAQLGEAYTELSALYDAESAKSGKSGDGGAASKVPRKGGKAGVASSKDGGDEGDLPEPKAAAGKKKPGGKKKVTEDDLRAAAKALIEALGEKKGKAKVVEILGGKLADVDEDEYADKLEELQAALPESEEGEEEGDVDDL
jgi:hypothetical protein